MSTVRPLDELRGARESMHQTLLQLPNVVGTGLGIKRRKDAVVATQALIVLVARKVERKRLGRHDAIPTFVQHRGKSIPTDVIQINGVRREFGDAPYALSDHATRGILSAFARDISGYVYGVSCAHCIAGADKNPHTTTGIGIWDPTSNRYEDVGQSVFAVEAPGYGLPGDYGFSDAGLVILDHPELAKRAYAAPTLGIITNPFRTMRVFGQAYGKDLSGTIDALEIVVGNLRIDIVVRVDGAGTFPGYSGLLWRTQSGHALGIHAYGAKINAETGGSTYSLTMSARRAAYQLQVQFLDPGWR